MDLSKITSKNYYKLSLKKIEKIVSSVFTPTEWEQTQPFDRERYMFFFKLYIKNDHFRQSYTLEEFLKEKKEQFMTYPRDGLTFDGKDLSQIETKKPNTTSEDSAEERHVKPNEPN